MKGVIYLSAIPMRKEPSDRSEMVNQVLFGETFDVLKNEEKWSRVRLHHDKYEGWIDNKQYEIYKKHTSQHTIIDKLFSRHGNQLLPMGAVVPNVSQRSNLQHTISGIAKKFLDTPYLWGGRTFMGIDCSGFTQVVFRVNGKNLLRDAYQQQTQGKKINFESATSGDLAYFSNEEGKVIHVGIILKEKNKVRIIHASGKVRIDSLDEKGILNNDTQSYSHRLHSIKRIK